MSIRNGAFFEGAKTLRDSTGIDWIRVIPIVLFGGLIGVSQPGCNRSGASDGGDDSSTDSADPKSSDVSSDPDTDPVPDTESGWIEGSLSADMPHVSDDWSGSSTGTDSDTAGSDTDPSTDVDTDTDDSPEVCVPDTCHGHGLCAVEAGLAVCACSIEYEGRFCESCAPEHHRDDYGNCVLDETCAGIDCGENGSCEVLGGVAICSCEDGYEGARCGSCAAGYHPSADAAGCIPDDFCRPTSCSGHGTCHDEGDLSCTCDEGYEGARCGSCAGGYHRDANDNCALDETCEHLSCGEHGSCSVEGGTAGCSCDEGFAGPACARCAPGFHFDTAQETCVRDEVCLPTTCTGHGACSTVAGVLSCDCYDGYGGAYCEMCAAGYHLDDFGYCVLNAECRDDQCGAHGDCYVDGGAALCACDEGYDGPDCSGCAGGFHLEDGACALDDACRATTCSGHGVCFDEGGLSCKCETGWSGPFCGVCAAGYHLSGADCVPDETCAGLDCGDHGGCVVEDGEVDCACDEGYRGELCARCEWWYQDYDRDGSCLPGCALVGATCPVYASCDDASGVARCLCDPGFEMDEAGACVPADDTGGDTSQADTSDTGSGTDDTDDTGDTGAVCRADSCSGNGRCVDSSGAVVCLCSLGYAGESCERCSFGYHFDDDGNCVPDVGCAGTDCGFGGECFVVGGEPTCSCDAPYTGAACNQCAAGYHLDLFSEMCVEDEVCVATSCDGHGLCEETGGRVTCECEDAYDGDRCERCAPEHSRDASGNCIPPQECDENSCFERGVCSIEAGIVSCRCDSGYSGTRCEGCASGYHLDFGTGLCVRDEVCLPATCSGAGACAVTAGGVECDCDEGYAGAFCERCDVDYSPDEFGDCVSDARCDGVTCSGHGACVSFGSEISCECDEGWGGAVCDRCDSGFHAEGDRCVPDESCLSTTCGVHGECYEVGEGVACACEPGYDAPSCSTCAAGYHAVGSYCLPDETCDSVDCGAHGACLVEDGIARCLCDEGYLGSSCSLCDLGYQDRDKDGSCLPDCSFWGASCPQFSRCEDWSGTPRCECDPGYIEGASGDCVLDSGQDTEATADTESVLDTESAPDTVGTGDTSDTDGTADTESAPDTSDTDGTDTAVPLDNECYWGTHDCDENARCINTADGWLCICNSGFEGDGTLCEDVDECTLLVAPCDDHGQCRNLPGSYECACDPGYENDGFQSCLPTEDGCVTDPFGRCLPIRIDAVSADPTYVRAGQTVTLEAEIVHEIGTAHIAEVAANLTRIGGGVEETMISGVVVDGNTQRFSVEIGTAGGSTGLKVVTIAATDDAGHTHEKSTGIIVYEGAVHHVGLGQPFGTIQAAIDAASNGDHVAVHPGTYTGPGNTLLSFEGKNLVLGATDGPEETVIDLLGGAPAIELIDSGESLDTVVSGFTVVNGGQGAVHMEVTERNTSVGLTVHDCVFDSNANGTAGGAMSLIGYPVSARIVESTFVDNAVTDGADDGGAIYVDEYNAVEIVECDFTGNRGRYGGAVFVDKDSSALVSGSSFRYNSGAQRGGAVYAGVLNLTGCIFRDNEANYHGGAIYADTDASVTGSSFKRNHAVGSSAGGGAIYARGPLDVRDCGFVYSSSTYHGGAVYAYSMATVEDALFRQNTAVNNGGGLYARSATQIRRTRFLGNALTTTNSSYGYGGGAYVTGGASSSIEDSVFEQNTTQRSGGALRAADVSIDRCAFRNNSAAVYGGAIYVRPTQNTIADSAFEGNTASNHGGAIYLSSSYDGSLTVDSSDFTWNSAGESGGAINVYHGDAFHVTGCTFHRNDAKGAEGQGGGIKISGTADTATIEHSVFTSNAAYRGGAVRVYGAPVDMFNLLIAGNIAEERGGGMQISSQGLNVSVHSSTLTDNVAGDKGGGIYHYAGALSLRDDIIRDNTAGMSVFSADLLVSSYRELATAQIEYCNVNADLPIEYQSRINSGAGYEVGVSGNIDDNPQFADPLADDYHLAADSSCLDAGSTTSEALGLDRRTTRGDKTPDSGIADLGYHYPID